jgi:hypothetical protein
MGNSIFNAFYSSNVQLISNATYQQSTMQSAGAQLLDLIGAPVWLLDHSQGGLMPLLIADARPHLTKDCHCTMRIASDEPEAETAC